MTSQQAAKDSSSTTVPWENNPVLEGSGDKGRKEKAVRPLNESSAAQQGDEKGEGSPAVPPMKSAKEASASPPRLPVGKMKWSQSEEQEPVPGGSSQPDGEFRSGIRDFPGVPGAEEGQESFSRRKAASPEKEGATERSSAAESPPRTEPKEPPGGKRIPVGVLKWRKDEEPDEAEKGKFRGKALLRLPEFLPGKAEESSEELSNAQRRLRKTAKVLWIPSLLFGSLLIGLLIGYAGLGDQPPTDVFDLDLWKHIYHLVYG